jgi:hypothetical protein
MSPTPLRCLLAASFLFVGLLGGCAASPRTTELSPTQMEALQVRQVDAPAERAFSAASGALVDAGYHILVSDADAGILSAELRHDPAVAANVATIIGVAVLSLGHVYYDLPPTYHALCLQVLPDFSPARSRVRIRSFVNAQGHHDPGKVEQIWTLMQRQVLMRELPAAP